ncbi:redoxin domain-containing protein [Hymenobacter sp. H14-R3]|uniref:redoxin domain-containing protein n=1 Tax=Hymenobacter sp. H14-R3 TaxID=3046308 RepID=UPI0024B8E7E6|nr:redoxin domain-containing protein [Hymenobacter sp. H14-R3]MDJ0367847.1 redoxin domain-containing protein [Hymenobacter sp. H14-R3]
MSLRKISIVLATALLLATVTVSYARAQGTVSDFTVQKTSGGSASLSAYTGQKAVVVVFMNPACAYTRLYQERLAALNSAYSGKGVQFMFVNVPINLDGAEGSGGSLATFTDDGAASAALSVSKTTEAVVLQPSGSGFAVRYRGAIDDNPQVASGVQQHYLQQVLDNVLAGRPAGVADKRAAGCLIKR